MRTVMKLAAMALALADAGAVAAPKPPGAAPRADDIGRMLAGHYDNRAQIAKTPSSAEQALPHVTIDVEPTPEKDFALWRVHVETAPDATFDQTWAMQARIEHDGSGALVPYYQLHQDAPPSAASFDPKGWLSLEACALRGDFGAKRLEGLAEGEPCVAVSMSVGARRALLPVAFVRSGDSLQVDLNLRGRRTHIEARRSK